MRIVPLYRTLIRSSTLDKTIFFEIDQIFLAKLLLFLLKRIKLKPEDKPAIQTSIATTVHRFPFYLFGVKSLNTWSLHFYSNRRLETIEWLEETSQDKGKDIWAKNDTGTYCSQCANCRQLTPHKVTNDIDRLVRDQASLII